MACTVAHRPEVAIDLLNWYRPRQIARPLSAFPSRPFQQSLSAVRSPCLAPWACCAAVGWPCICLCVSCDDVATSSVARFIVPVGGCWVASIAVPVVWPAPSDAGPEPASFRFAARPLVSQGPAVAVLALKMTMEQPARISRFVFMCSSFAPDVRPDAPGRTRNGLGGCRFRMARRISLLFNRALSVSANHRPQIFEAIDAIIVQRSTRVILCNLSYDAGSRPTKLAAWPVDIDLRNLACNADWKGAPQREVDG